MDISPNAQVTALQHELAEQQRRVVLLRQECYGWQERVFELEDELDFLWNSNSEE